MAYTREKAPNLTDTHLTAPTRFVEIDGDRFAYRRRGNSSTGQPLTMTFRDAARGFAILSAKDGKEAFLAALHDEDLVISGDFVEVMWFQGLTEYLQSGKTQTH